MNPLQPFSTLNYNSRAASSDAVEMLQTDVMRFFAILCLCLMAIFALVKALPLAQSERPIITEPADLKQEVQSLQTQIAELRQKLTKIKTRSQSALIAAEQSALQAQKAAKDEQEVLNRLLETRQQLKEANRSLDQTRRQLEKHELRLAGLIDEIEQKRQFRSKLDSQINQETQKLKRLQASLNQTERILEQQPAQQMDVAPPAAAPSKAADREGHVLRFASDAALQTLISAGEVKFYAMAGRRTWRLRWTGRQPDFVVSQNPRQIYEMEPATVPAEFTAAFKQQVPASGPTAVTWGVTLPPQTKTTIEQLVRGKRGGELVIMSNGKVVLR